MQLTKIKASHLYFCYFWHVFLGNPFLGISICKNHANSVKCDKPKIGFTYFYLCCFLGLYGEMYNYSFQSVCSLKIIHIENLTVFIVFYCHFQNYLYFTDNQSFFLCTVIFFIAFCLFVCLGFVSGRLFAIARYLGLKSPLNLTTGVYVVEGTSGTNIVANKKLYL